MLFEKWGQAPVNNDSSNIVTKYISTNSYGFSGSNTPAPGYTCNMSTYNWGIGSFTVTGSAALLVDAVAAGLLSFTTVF